MAEDNSLGAAYIDPATLFSRLDADRESGDLAQQVTGCDVRYQISPAHPGWLEQIRKDGCRAMGRFVDGQFVPRENN